MSKQKITSKNYGFEALESYNKYVPNSDSIQDDLKEIRLQYLLKGFDIDNVHAYWAWLHFCESIKQPWMPLNSSYDCVTLMRNFVAVERPKT